MAEYFIVDTMPLPLALTRELVGYTGTEHEIQPTEGQLWPRSY